MSRCHYARERDIQEKITSKFTKKTRKPTLAKRRNILAYDPSKQKDEKKHRRDEQKAEIKGTTREKERSRAAIPGLARIPVQLQR